MSIFFSELGINWRLLATQGVNFFVLLGALTVLVYRPLLGVMAERRKKIEFGLKGAEEAERRLDEIEDLKKKSVSEAEKRALALIGDAEKSAKERFEEILAEGRDKAAAVLSEAERMAAQRKIEEMRRLEAEAAQFVKRALVKAVELDPEAVDEKLIGLAVEAVKESRAL